MSIGDGPPVDVWFEVIGDGPATVMRYTEVCPSCGASWGDPMTVRLGGSASGATFWCVSCEVNHPQRRLPSRGEVGREDVHGRPVQ